MLVNDKILRIISRDRKTPYTSFIRPLNNAFEEFGIVTDQEKCHFLAQAMHETMGFKYLRELGKESYFAKYDSRVDLGNIKPGDGARYKGRGLFQVTGRFNYKRASDYFKMDFMENPELLEHPDWACRTAGWFWKNNKLSEYVGFNDFLEVTYRINGGFNGLVDRYNKLIYAFQAFGFEENTVKCFKEDLLKKIIEIVSNPTPTRYRSRLLKIIPTVEVAKRVII